MCHQGNVVILSVSILNVPVILSHCNCPNVVIVEEGLSETDTDAFCPRCVCRYNQIHVQQIQVQPIQIDSWWTKIAK